MARKKRRNKSRQSQKSQFPIEVVGIILIIMSVLAIGQFGVVGVFLTNLFRAVVGETYIGAALLVILLGLYHILKGKMPDLLNRRILGGFFVYLSVLLFVHLNHFKSLAHSANVFSATWQRVTQEFSRNQVSVSLGGGMVGGGLFQLNHTLFGMAGIYILIVLLMFVGIMTFGQFSYKSSFPSLS